MSKARVELRMGGLIAIANAANAALAEPRARSIARAAGDGYRVDTWPRASPSGWARTRVWTDTPEAMRREARYGTLARSL